MLISGGVAARALVWAISSRHALYLHAYLLQPQGVRAAGWRSYELRMKSRLVLNRLAFTGARVFGLQDCACTDCSDNSFACGFHRYGIAYFCEADAPGQTHMLYGGVLVYYCSLSRDSCAG